VSYQSRAVASLIRASPGCAASTAASTAAAVRISTSENPNQSPSTWHDGGSIFWFTSLTNARTAPSTSVGSKILVSICCIPQSTWRCVFGYARQTTITGRSAITMLAMARSLAVVVGRRSSWIRP